jgi:hypothetical protein
MKRIVLSVVTIITILSLFAVLVAAQVERLQPPRPGQEVLRKSPPPPPEERIKEMLDRITTRLKLSEEGKKAVEKLVMARIEARRSTEKELRTLRRLARDRNASETDIREALAKFRKELQEKRAKIRKLEEEALKVVPVKAQLMLTVAGIFDNGLPFPQAPRAQRGRPERPQRPGRKAPMRPEGRRER